MILDYIKTQGQLTAHKFWVAYFMFKVALKIINRAIRHDLSKYKNVEAIPFTKNKDKLAHTPYGTPAYSELLKQVQPALDHHYANNSHHPQFHPNGFKDMSFLDRLEMACDWNAAVKRTKDGDIRFSIEENQKRFGYTNEDKVWISSLVDEIERRERSRK